MTRFADPRPTADRRPPSGAGLITVLALLCTVTALLQTMAVPVLAKMSDDLGVSTAAIGWVVTINLLAAAVLTPVLSKSGDLHGRRRVLLLVVAAIAVGSLVAAVTSNYWVLLASRVMQGASFCLFPLSVGILRASLPLRRLALGMSFLTGAISVGAGVGLVLTGVLTHGDRDYRNVFWFTLVLSVALLALASVVVPRDVPHARGRVDWLGGVLLGSGLVLVLLAMTQGNDWGWTSVATLGCAVGGVLVLALWQRLEKHVAEPLVPVEMLRHGTLAAANLVGFMIGLGTFMVFLAVTALVQVPATDGHGFSASVLETSLVYLLPGALIGVVASPAGGMCVTRFGGRATLFAACVLCLAGYLQLLWLHDRPWQVVLGTVVTNAAFAVGFAAVPAVVVSVVRPEETALANAMASISRSTGSALGSALVVALVAHHTMTDGHPDETVFVVVFAIGAASMVVAALVTLVGIPRHRPLSGPATRS